MPNKNVMRSFLKYLIIVFFSVLVLLICGIFSLPFLLKQNGITYSKIGFSLPFKLRIENLDVNKSDVKLNLKLAEVDIKLLNIISKEIEINSITLKDGLVEIINSSDEKENNPITFLNEYKFYLKQLDVANVKFKNESVESKLVIDISTLKITKIKFNKKIEIDSILNDGLNLTWQQKQLAIIDNSKTEKKESDLGILSFPNFKVKNIATKNCNIDFKTIKQHHKFSNLNFNINSSKEKDNLQMAVNELSLTYQDTITIALKLNKLLINDQKEYHLKNLAIDIPNLRLNIPDLYFSDNKSSEIKATIVDSYINTKLISFFNPTFNSPFKKNTNINFKGDVIYKEEKINLTNFQINLAKNTQAQLSGFASLSDTKNGEINFRIDNIKTNSSDVKDLFGFNLGNANMKINISSSLNVSGNYSNILTSGVLKLNNNTLNFAIGLDQRSKQFTQISTEVSSKALKPSTLSDKIDKAIVISNIKLSSLVTINNANQLSNLQATITCSNLKYIDYNFKRPILAFQYNKRGSFAKITIPETLSLKLHTNDDISKDAINFNGELASILPKFSNLNESVGDLESSFKGEFINSTSKLELSLILDTLLFSPINSIEKYSSYGNLKVSKSKSKEIYFDLSLADKNTISLATEESFFDWIGDKNKFNLPYPNIDLQVALQIDSTLLKDIADVDGEIDIKRIDIQAKNNSASINFDIPKFNYNEIRIQNADARIESFEEKLFGEFTILKFENPYAELAKLKLGIDQISNNTLDVNFKTFLPEVNDSIEVNGFIEDADGNFLINISEEKDLLFGSQNWKNNKSKGFLFDENYKFISGDLNISNKNQFIQIETTKHEVALQVERLDLSPIAQILTNDSLFRGELNMAGSYKFKSNDLNIQGSINNIAIDTNKLGNLIIQIHNNDDYFKSTLSLKEKYGDIKLNIEKSKEPINYNIAIECLDLGYLNQTFSPYHSAVLLSGHVDANIKGIYNNELKSYGYISFNNIEAYIENKFYFKTENDTILFRNNDLSINDFKLYDNVGGSININGNISNLTNPSISLKIKTDKFRLLDAIKSKDNLKGIADISTNLQIIKNKNKSQISGSIALLQNSSIDYTLESSISLDDREKELTFVSFATLDSINNLSTLTKNNKKVNKPINWDVNLNVEPSDFNIVLNETYQDKIKVKGAGNLVLKSSTNNTPLLFGMLQSKEGNINYAPPLLSDLNLKIENIQAIWNGDMYNPRLTVRATESFKVDPKGIPGTSSSTGLVPVEVIAKMDDSSISEFKLTFDLNSTNSQVNNWIQSLPEDSRQANAINLLLFGTLNFGEMNNAAVFQGVVSKMNEISRRNIKNADLSFSVDNNNIDESTSDPNNQLNFNYSKGIIKDKMKVSVGGFFDIDGNSNSSNKSPSGLNNVQLDYILSKNPEITLILSQKNDYDGVINGQVNASSLGITYSKRFKNLFRKNTKKNSK